MENCKFQPTSCRRFSENILPPLREAYLKETSKNFTSSPTFSNAVASSAADGDENVDVLLAAETPPEENVFLSELKAAANTKSWERALNLLDGMREAGYAPHPGAYACAIRCGSNS